MDEVYKQKLTVVLEFFVSKLPLYYSSSRLTLLITLLEDVLLGYHTGPRNYLFSLPSRLETLDNNALRLHKIIFTGLSEYSSIFQVFLNSSHPLALNRQRYATAALALLKIIFKYYQALLSPFSWLGQHSRTLRVATKQHSQQHHTDLPAGTDWEQSIQFYWYLRNYFPTSPPKGDSDPDELYFDFTCGMRIDFFRSAHLQFLLEKSTHSNNILNFAHHRVFRFGYLHRKHPTYIKKAIFALAKYIQRVTGETAEVKACESIWGHQKWFTKN
jgi:hypothetical protein